VKIREIPAKERPREKLAAHGAGALSDAELLAIFLRTGTPSRSAIAVARDLIASKGSLRALARCDAHELSQLTSGVGPAKAAELVAAVELGKRLARGDSDRPVLDSADAVYEVLAPVLEAANQEVIHVVLLDTKLRLIVDQQVALGSLNECIAHPREIFRPAVVHRAHAIIVIHNHPSGDPTPSRADHTITRRLQEAAEFLQIELLDHIIFGTPDGGRHPFFSFRDAGIL